MSEPLIDVMLCVNDDNGNDSGLITALQIPDFIDLECEGGLDFYYSDGAIGIHHGWFAIENYATLVGNMLWDCAWMTPEVAAGLLNYLNSLKMWGVEEAECGLWDKWHKNEYFAAGDFLGEEPEVPEEQKLIKAGYATLPGLE